MSKRLSIELSDELAAYAQAKVMAGEYTSLDAAVAAGVRNLQQHDALIERWIKDEVIPSIRQWEADGRPTLSEDEVFNELEDIIAEAERRKRAS